MTKDYEKFTDSTRERLENEFRNLLLVIPFHKRIELEKIVREECFVILQSKLAQFDEHWTLASNESVDSQISGWKDYVDPITGKTNESDLF
jgi:hypothetical protein